MNKVPNRCKGLEDTLIDVMKWGIVGEGQDSEDCQNVKQLDDN